MKDFNCNLNFEAKIIAKETANEKCCSIKRQKYNSCTSIQVSTVIILFLSNLLPSLFSYIVYVKCGLRTYEVPLPQLTRL